MKRKIACAAVLVCIVSALTGCMGDAPLHKRLIVQNTGVDKTGGEYRLSLNAYIAGDAGEEEGSLASTTFFSRNGQTIVDAIANLGLVTGRIPFFSHNEVLVIGEDTAREGISGPMGFFMEYFECRAGVDVFIARGTAEDIIACKSKDETAAAKNFQELSQIGKISGKVIHKTVLDVGASISNPSMDLCLPCVSIESYQEDGEEKQRIVSGGTAVFRNDRLAGYLDETETKGYLLLTNDLQHLSINAAVEGYGTITVDFRKVKTQVEIRIKDGQPVLQVIVEAEGEPVEKLNLNGKVLDDAFYGELKRQCGLLLEAYMVKCLEKTAALGVDPYGFGAVVWRDHPSFWNAHSGEWQTLLAQATYRFDVRPNIRQIHKSLQQ